MFLAASDEQQDDANQRDLRQVYENYINNICSAICSAWRWWQSVATLRDVKINGPIATGGRVAAPGWGPQIRGRRRAGILGTTAARRRSS